MLRYFSRIASPWGSTLSLRQKPPDLDQLDIQEESLVGVDGLGDGARSRTSNHLCNSNSTGNQSRSSSASSRTLVDPLDYDKFGRAALQLQVSDPDHQSISITELYYQCQNLAHYPLAPVLARRYLQRFLSSCFNRDSAAALGDNPDSIFSLSSEFNDFETKEWLDSQYRKTADRFQSYLSRRKNAGPREMFKDRKDAERWCKQSAVVKYVDGSWLQSTFQSTSGLEVVVAGQTYSVKSARRASRVSWQVLSEELGDGDLHKEHCAVYERLMDSLQGEDTPRADDETFVDWNRNENGEIPNKQPYVAAMLQLAMSTSPNEFLPEILGFNLSYEGLPYHLLVTSQELKELKIDPYYFVLHISIDNAHSGHSAMARMAVSDFLSSAASTHGKHQANKLWKRVQAGFHLADYVRTTPETFKELEKKTTLADPLFWNEDIPIFPEEDLAVLEHVKLADNNYEQQLLAVFRAKAHAAQGLHTTAPGKIGGKSIGEWLTTEGLEGRRGKAFMEALGSNRAWIVPGENCHQSRLIKQCEWGGKMFGAFTNREVGLLRAWAGSLPAEENLSKPVPSNNDAKTALVAPYLDFIHGSRPTSGIEMEWRRYFDTAVQPLDLSDSLQHISSFSAWIQAAPAVYETLLRHPHGIRGLLKAHTNGFLTQLLPPLGPTPPHFIAEILSRQIGSDDGIQQMTFLKRLLPVLFLSSALLEWMPAASPAKLASPLGMATIRTQRVLHGFSDAYEVEAVCAGTDDVTTVKVGIWDLATEMIPHGDIFTLRSFEDYEGEALALPALILLLNSQPTLHLPILLGVQLCLNVHLHAPLSRESWTPSDAWRRRLEEITSQSRPHIIHAIELGACEETSRAWEGLGDWNENVSLGFKIAKICLST